MIRNQILHPQLLQALPGSEKSVLWVCYGSHRGEHQQKYTVDKNHTNVMGHREMNTIKVVIILVELNNDSFVGLTEVRQRKKSDTLKLSSIRVGLRLLLSILSRIQMWLIVFTRMTIVQFSHLLMMVQHDKKTDTSKPLPGWDAVESPVEPARKRSCPRCHTDHQRTLQPGTAMIIDYNLVQPWSWS